VGAAAGAHHEDRPHAGEQSKVEISPEATALAAAADDGSFDAAKVQAMSNALKNGTFEVNAEKIADKLIANAQELLARTYR
jgi:negative regulator of flagellin synthesis FlgM